ncbi:MAG: Unknown protein [uncultured Sulfurovum sp.]|uniref:Uncharacterized protein n=1 Tax=uncultured Sulfurovum sp. TaxID=269237 RepID=A0A6S6SH30_9BACT|nr:MAG: Unknown protein [uncultured Sulfurovum sp.]
MLNEKSKVINYINGLGGYRGYVQFSHRPIDIERDVFIDHNPSVKDEEGFILEAHFFNGSTSLSIRQVNAEWIVDESLNIPLDNLETYHGIDDLKIKMAQIWTLQQDDNCANLEVLKLNKVVFAGVEK